MNEHDFSSHERPQKQKVQRHGVDKIQYLLSAEEQLLHLISTRAPLPGVLNEICSALDCQIGNVVSLISLPEDDSSELATIAANAALFGLYVFCSEGVVSENEELLATLEMYCCILRRPSPSEFELIERAKCLAAIAIKLDREADRPGQGGTRRNRPAPGRLLEWPVSLN
jgi:hypothetical protein